MKRLLQLFVDILFLQAGPQDLPASRVLLVIAVAASVVASTMLARETLAGPTALARVGLELGLTVGLLALLLGASGRGARFQQSLIALCGTGAILAILAWPLFGRIVDHGPEDSMAALAMLLLWGLYGWSILVTGHILRHALDTGLGRGIALALLYALLVVAVGEWVLPVRSSA